MKRLVIVTLASLVWATASHPAILHVPGDYTEIQQAIEAAVDGDRVLVQPGTYEEALDFLGKGIAVTGTAPLDSAVVANTVVDAPSTEEDQLSVVTFQSGEGPTSVLEGLTLTGGHGTNVAWGIYTSTAGGGVYCVDSDPTLSHCVVVGNRTVGAGYRTSQFGGAGMYVESSSPALTNLTITGNSTEGHGGGLYCAASFPTLTNCTITGNSTEGYGGGLYCVNSSPTLTNCILWADYRQEIYLDWGTPIVTYSNIEGGWDGEGNIDADPRFCSTTCPTWRDLHLAADSPCLGTGLEGTDIGAWGLGCEEPVEPSPGILDVPNDYGTIAEALSAVCEGDTILIAPGTYLESGLRIPEFGLVVQSWDREDSSVVASTVINGDGGDVVVFESSLTFPASTLAGVTITGGGTGIRCDSTSPFVDCCTIIGNSASDVGGGLHCRDSSSPTITNCTITENSAGDVGGGLYCDDSSSPTLTNCTITGNSADWDGGGLYCDNSSSPTLTNCILWADSPEEISVSSGTPTLTYSNIEGGWEGEGNIDADPRFFSYLGYDNLLRPDSPCIDAGDPAVEDAIYDWHPRWPAWFPDGPRSDMGATGGPGNVGWWP